MIFRDQDKVSIKLLKPKNLQDERIPEKRLAVTSQRMHMFAVK